MPLYSYGLPSAKLDYIAAALDQRFVVLTNEKYAHILLAMEKQLDQQERERIERLATTCVCSNLRRASRAVTNYYDSLLGQVSELRISQVIVLVVLYLAGPQTINELAEIMALDRTTVGRNLKPLAQQGLLSLTSGSDQRTRVVTLTAQGEETLLRVLPQWEQAQARMISGMGQGQVDALLAQLSTAAANAHDN
jgi:DNA-binding MarR family transcriptional regulator